MATITPSVVNSPKETSTSKGGYLRLTITSITDSDAETNKRYIGCKLTIEGTRWVGLYRWESTLGGQTVSTETRTVEDWYPGHVLATKNLTFDNDSAGNLSLTAYIKHIFYKGSGSWNTSYAKSITETLVCSQLPRYANFTSHSATSTLNTITVSYAADATYGAQQYSLDGGSWTNCTAGSYTLSGFTPGSSHTIKTRIQRSDSGLWTESSQISISLKSLPTSNNVSNINFNSSGTRVDVSISSKDYLSQWYVKIYDGNTLVRDGSNAPNYASSTSDYWTIQNSDNSNMLNRHGSVNSWTLTVKFYVISNGTTYELSSKTCTCTIPSGSYLPTYNSNNLSYEVTNTTSNDITGSNQKVIKGISNVRIKTTQASPQGGASMSSYTATSGTKSGTSTSLSNTYIDLSNVDSNSFSVQATDTRGRSTVASKSYSTYIDYFAPYSTAINVSRVNGVEANIIISFTGRYMYWSNLQVPNAITQVAVQYKLRSSSSWTTISGFNLSISAGSNGVFTATGTTTGSLFNISNEYDVRVILQDKFNQVSSQGIIYTANVLLWKDVANHRLGIGKKPVATLDVNGNISASSNINSSGYISASGKISGNYLEANSYILKKYHYIDLSGLSTSNFYPVLLRTQSLVAAPVCLECEIHSKGLGGSDPYNQNYINFMIKTGGWSDTPTTLTILQCNQHNSDEITIGAIGHGTSRSYMACVWLRGGYPYSFITNAGYGPYLCSSDTWDPDSSDNGSKFTVGTSYHGGTNTNVNILWDPTYSNSKQGFYSLSPITIRNNDIEVDNGYIKVYSNSRTLQLGSQNSTTCHYVTNANSHWFNKNVLVQGDVYAGSSYNRRLAYRDELPTFSSGTGDPSGGSNGDIYIKYS